MKHAATYQIGGWFAPGSPYQVAVRVKSHSWPQALLESPPALPGISVDAEQASVLVRFLATEPYAPARWILPFGGDAEALEPPAVRDLVRQRMTEALALYQGRGRDPDSGCPTACPTLEPADQVPAQPLT